MTGEDLVAWRRHLHARPEASGREEWTAGQVAAALDAAAPDAVVRGLGGHGVAAVYEGPAPGQTIMVRCELDGLPIPEISDLAYRSTIPCHGHLCGHDGHMAIVLGLAHRLSRRRPAGGRVVLLFQPAEEDGSGAAAVLADPRFAPLAPDWAFALHNMPGLPLGHASVMAGPVNCASRGLRMVLTGRTAHASRPDEGVASTMALAELLAELTALRAGDDVTDPAFRLATVTHAALGEPTFGVAPGRAELRVTLRTLRDDGMAELVAVTVAGLDAAGRRHGLVTTFDEHDVFVHCDNDPEATAILAQAVADAGLSLGTEGLPMRGSEDFGRFGRTAKSAMLLLGAGTDRPGLHAPDYDFPDQIIPMGVAIFERAIEQVDGIRQTP